MSAPSDRRPPPDAAHRSAGGGNRPWYRVERVLVGCGLGLLPWMVVLAGGLPAVDVTGRWHVVWIGLDTLECLGLIATGLLAERGHRLYPLTATATGTLLVVDAWFDTMTAASGAERVSAVAMALGAELPLAVVCVVLAAKGLARLMPALPAVPVSPVVPQEPSSPGSAAWLRVLHLPENPSSSAR
ncbi:hypothetical protein [Streptomyces similanensis]